MANKQTKKRLSSDERRKVFLEAAANLIRQDGVERLSMESLAAACDVNKALPYRFFSNRDEVLLALYEAQHQEFDEVLGTFRESATSFRDEVTAMVDTWMQFLSNERGIPGLETARTVSGELESRRQQRHVSSLKYIQSLIDSEYDVPEDLVQLMAGVLYSGSQGFAMSFRPGRDASVLKARYVDMVMGAIDAVAEPADSTKRR